MKIFLIIVLTVVTVVSLPKYTLNACTTISECDQSLQDIAKQKEEKNTELAGYKAEEDNLSKRITMLADDIKIAEEEINTLNQSLTLLSGRILTLTEQITTTEEYIGNRLVVQQKQNNSNTYLTLLVSATSITDLMKRWSAIDRFNREDKKLLSKLASDKEELSTIKMQQEERQEVLGNVRATLVVSKQESETAIAEKRAVIIATEDIMSQIQMTEEEIQWQREILNRPIPDVPSPGGGGPALPTTGEWALPVTDAIVTTMYMSPTYQQEYKRTHPALDIGRYEGAPLYAVADGWVILSDYETQFGYVTAISHNIDGVNYVSFYAHQSAVYVARGEYIRAGTQIGKMGNTGTASNGSHLHFELYKGRDDFTYNKFAREQYSVDPLNYLPYEGNWSIRWDAW